MLRAYIRGRNDDDEHRRGHDQKLAIAGEQAGNQCTKVAVRDDAQVDRRAEHARQHQPAISALFRHRTGG